MREDATTLKAKLFGEGVAEAHHDATFRLLAQPIRVKHHADTENDQHAFDMDTASAAHADFRHGRVTGIGVESAGEPKAAAAEGFGRLPGELIGGGLDGVAHARMGEVVEAELERVEATLRGHNVDVRLAAEGVAVDRGRSALGLRRMGAWRGGLPPCQPPAATVR